MNEVPMVVSAGSKYEGTKVVCTPHVTCPSGAAAAGATMDSSARTTRKRTRRLTEFSPFTGKLRRRPRWVNRLRGLTFSVWRTRVGVMPTSFRSSRSQWTVSVLAACLALCTVILSLPALAGAQAAKPPTGELRWALHVTLAARWLDPAETEAFSTPFMVMYAVHDAMVRPMPAGLTTPSLAESWTAAKDHLSYPFVLRKGVRFHNGDPVTAEDVKFSWDRYKGASAKLLKDKVKDVVVVDPGQVRFLMKEPWPDFITFYGTTASGAGWIVPKKYVEKVGDDGFKTAPIGAGPYKVVSFKPGVELVLEAFDGYWRKAPSVKRLVMRSMPEEATRAAALRAGEVDIAYLLTGPTADSVRKVPGFRLAAPLASGAFWLELPEQ